MQNFLSFSDLDRGDRFRQQENWITAARSAPHSRFLITWRGHILCPTMPHAPETASAIGLYPMQQLPDLLTGQSNWQQQAHFLGLLGEESFFAIDASAHEVADFGLDAAALDLRQIATLIPAAQAGLAAFAIALGHWHRNHRFCGRCGNPSHSSKAGHERRCSNDICGHVSYPRTDPAVIMLVHDGADHILLGRQASWAEGVYSVLAGFVEPGESLEAAVQREVAEEVGISVGQPRYHSSQPWPFPSSIMLGFIAQADRSQPLAVNHDEIEKAFWIARQEIPAAIEAGWLKLPRTASIARRMIDEWLQAGG